MQLKVEFFSKLPYLRQFSKFQMRRLVYQLIPQKYKRNHLVYTQGEKAQYIYIVKDGDFEIFRTQKQHRKQEKSCNKIKMQIDRRPNLIDIRIRMTSRGYLLGHEDVFNDRNYTTSVRCSSHEGTVFAMKADEFLDKMGLH